MRSLENMNIEFSIWKQINISITLVSESYAILYYEKKVYLLFMKKICLNQILNDIHVNLPVGAFFSRF
jgi:hypothetical protein